MKIYKASQMRDDFFIFKTLFKTDKTQNIGIVTRCLKIPRHLATYSFSFFVKLFFIFFISFHRLPWYFKTLLSKDSLKYQKQAFRLVLISFFQKRHKKRATPIKVKIQGSLRGVPSETLKIISLGTK